MIFIFSLIKTFFPDVPSYFLLNIFSNVFEYNYANENGGCFYISNENSGGEIIISNNNLISNWITLSSSSSLGSIVYLTDPGAITIKNSIFQNNSGISGTCIYYSETRNYYKIQLESNTFKDNKAKYGVAGVYYASNYDNIDPFKNNSFINNLALYGNDVGTMPYQIRLINNINNNLLRNKKQYNLNMISGVSTINLIFNVLDYYGQVMKSLSGSYSLLYLKNSKNFSDIYDSSLKIIGVNSATIINGNKNMKKN